VTLNGFNPGIAVIVLIAISSFLSPFYLIVFHSNMSPAFGNPRPVYFYDVTPVEGCVVQVETALTDLSNETGLKFIRLPYGAAYLGGGLSYDCSAETTDPVTIGEYQSSTASFLSFNKIILKDTDEETVLHETLHSLGFDHTTNPNSIMYPYHHGSSKVDTDIIDFIKRAYVLNPFAYLNIIPFNVVLFLLILVGLSKRY